MEVLAVVSIEGEFPEVAVGGSGIAVFEGLGGGGDIAGVAPDDGSASMDPGHDLGDIGSFSEFGFWNFKADFFACFGKWTHVIDFLLRKPGLVLF